MYKSVKKYFWLHSRKNLAKKYIRLYKKIQSKFLEYKSDIDSISYLNLNYALVIDCFFQDELKIHPELILHKFWHLIHVCCSDRKFSDCSDISTTQLSVKLDNFLLKAYYPMHFTETSGRNKSLHLMILSG